MEGPFSRRGDVIRVGIEPAGAQLIHQILTDTATLVGQGTSNAADDIFAELAETELAGAAPEDPAEWRLFPDAYLEDEEASADFRRFTEAELRSVRADRITAMQTDLARLGRGQQVTLSAAQAQLWLTNLNDIRLVLGTRLDITEDDQELEIVDDDPNAPLIATYHWITWVQHCLLETLTG